VTLIGSVSLVFLALRLAPGDPADNILGDDAPEAAKQAFRQRLGLDQPLGQQYGDFISSLARGDFGDSYGVTDRPVPVADLLADALPATVELAGAAMLVAVLIAVPFGTWAAARQHGPVDIATLAFAMLGAAVPVFWSGPVVLYLGTVVLGLFPGPTAPLIGVVPLILPALVLGAALAAKLLRTVRASVLDALRQDYVLAARARGLGGARVLLVHVLGNAWIPILTVMGLQLAGLLSGAIVTEKVFARPGLGSLLLEGIARRDYAVVQGCVVTVTLAYVLVNLLIDAAYVLVDPRLRRGADQGARAPELGS
jgi:peptide/nickel transport system permease protein